MFQLQTSAAAYVLATKMNFQFLPYIRVQYVVLSSEFNVGPTQLPRPSLFYWTTATSCCGTLPNSILQTISQCVGERGGHTRILVMKRNLWIGGQLIEHVSTSRRWEWDLKFLFGYRTDLYLTILVDKIPIGYGNFTDRLTFQEPLGRYVNALVRGDYRWFPL